MRVAMLRGGPGASIERHAAFLPQRAGALSCQRARLSDDAKQHSEARGGTDEYQMLMVRRDRGDDAGSNPL